MTGLTWVEIEAFRGFANRQRIPLNTNFVLISGGNGVGKSSVVDAITWVLTGGMSHVSRRKRRRTEEFVLSAYRPGEAARVALGMEMNGMTAVATRTGQAAHSSLRLEVNGRRHLGDVAEIELARLFGLASPGELRDSVDRWGVLRQDEVRAILEADPDEIHSRLRDLLGLGVLDDFEAFADSQFQERTRANVDARKRIDTAQSAVDKAESTLAEIDGQLSTVSEGSAAQQRLSELIEAGRSDVRLQLDLPADVETYRLMTGQLRLAYSSLQQIRAELANIDRQITELPKIDLSAEDVARRRAARAESQRTLEEELIAAQQALTTAQQSSDQASALAAAATPLLGETCPVCGQSIDPAHVAARLRESAEGASARQILAARERVDAVRRQQAAFEAVRINEERLESVADDVERRKRELEAAVQSVRQQLVSVSNASITFPRLTADASTSDIDATIDALTSIGQALRLVLATAEVGALGDHRAAAVASLSAARARLGLAIQDAERTASLLRESDQLRKGARAAGVEVTKSALRALNPHFGEVYRRLAPHPTFTDLGLTHDVYYNKGRTLPVLTDPVAHVEANPGTICSIGQLNIVALSYFLALALLGDDPPLPFVVLDDPLQSLDDVNVLGFADLSRYLRARRQVIVTTHDRRYAELLERKLAPRSEAESSLTIDFESWDRSGPTLTTRHVPTVEAPRILRQAS